MAAANAARRKTVNALVRCHVCQHGMRTDVEDLADEHHVSWQNAACNGVGPSARKVMSGQFKPWQKPAKVCLTASIISFYALKLFFVLPLCPVADSPSLSLSLPLSPSLSLSLPLSPSLSLSLPLSPSLSLSLPLSPSLSLSLSALYRLDHVAVNSLSIVWLWVSCSADVSDPSSYSTGFKVYSTP